MVQRRARPQRCDERRVHVETSDCREIQELPGLWVEARGTVAHRYLHDRRYGRQFTGFDGERGQLFQQQRSARSTLDDLRHYPVVELWSNGYQQAPGVALIQPLQRQASDTRFLLQANQLGPPRMSLPDLLVAVGSDQHQAQVRDTSRCVFDELPCRVVSPLDVVQDP